MPQVVPDRRQFRTACKRVGGMRMTHPVRAGKPQLFRQHRMLGMDHVGRCPKEAPMAQSRVPVMPSTVSDSRLPTNGVFGFQRADAIGRPRSARYPWR